MSKTKPTNETRTFTVAKLRLIAASVVKDYRHGVAETSDLHPELTPPAYEAAVEDFLLTVSSWEEPATKDTIK